MKSGWQIRVSTFFLIAWVLTLVLFPILPDLILPIIALIIFAILKKHDHIKKTTIMDFFLIFIYFILGIFGLLYFQILILATVPWWKIIIVGLAVDVVASLLGAIPVFGDILSAIIAGMIAIIVIGGFEGILLAVLVGCISLLPGPSLGANTIMLILFKIVAELMFL